MNRAKWLGLAPEHQKVIESLSGEYAEKLSRLWDEKDRSTMKKWSAKGHHLIFLSEEEEQRWEAAVRPLYQIYVKEKSARGLRATEALEFCQEWVKENMTETTNLKKHQ
jgi:TRAP-type C4-dicarboxylate transport system substrate-binding protein